VRILVTGGSGFIGKNLSFPKKDFFDGVFYFHHGEGWEDFIHREGAKFDVCLHLAANGNPSYSVENPISDLMANTIFLISVIQQFDIKRFIFMSSGAVYLDGCGIVGSSETIPDPKLPYAISKLASEQYVKYFQDIGKIKEYIILRHFGSFGPYEPERKVTTRFLNGDFKIRGDGQNKIDLMYIKDTVRALQKVIFDKKNKNKIYDFCKGDAITITELAEGIQDILGAKSNIIYEGETCEDLFFEGYPTYFNRDFDFEPEYTLEEGIKEFMKWRDGQL